MSSRHAAKGGLAGMLLVFMALALLDFVIVRPNRLLPGEGYVVFEVVDGGFVFLLFSLLALIFLLLLAGGRWLSAVLSLLPVLVFLVLYLLGSVAQELEESGGMFTRISIGPALWVMLVGLLVIFCDISQRDVESKNLITLTIIVCFTAFVWLFATGTAENLSLVMEYRGRSQRFWAELLDHVIITFASVGSAVLIGVPVGMAMRRYKKARKTILSLLSTVQTIPSLALFGLLLAPLAYVASVLPILQKIGFGGIGWAPAVIALTLYALLPVVSNTFVGLSGVSSEVVEAGQGMGMNRRQLLVKVEMPIALPVILAGIRIAAVQNIGNTAVAALIGAGGFGVFIFQGLGQSAVDLVLLGALPTIALAVMVDYMWQLIIAMATPKGLK